MDAADPDPIQGNLFTYLDVTRWPAPDITDLISPPTSPAPKDALEKPIRWPSARQVKVAGSVWHYTNGEGLLGILRNDAVWASSAATLNDSREIWEGVEALEKRLRWWRKQGEIDSRQADFAKSNLAQAVQALKQHRVFVVSASLASDRLSQWRGYGGEQSYAVALDVNRPLRPLSETPILRDSAAVVPGPWMKVAYGKSKFREQIDAASRLLLNLAPVTGEDEATLAGHPGILLWRILPYLKHKSFREENEARLCHIVPPESALRHEPALNFRAGRRMPIPYLDLGAHIRQDGDEFFKYWARNREAKLPIRKVIIGPGHYDWARENAVRALLDRYGYEHVKIGHSRSTYRQFER